MTRVIVHAGFHKTGTSSLQNYLGHEAGTLRPWFDFHGQGDGLHRSAVAGRIFAKKPFLWRRRAFRQALRADLVDMRDAEVIVLSREHYSGVMPGHLDWRNRVIPNFRRAAKPLARVMVQELRRRFGPDVEITFFYTTRERESWLRSVHGHLLRSIRLTDDFETFRARFDGFGGPTAEAEVMRRALAPIPVVTAALEEVADRREGPAAALLDLIELPHEARAKLPPAERANAGQTADLRDALLALNRKDLSKDKLRREKQALIAQSR